MRKSRRTARLLAVLATIIAGPAAGQSLEDKVSLCVACHGEKGIPTDKSIPVLSGQNEGYIYLQLRDFKLGNRKSEVMGTITAGLERQDMKELAAWFAAQPWPDLRQPSAPQDVAKHALTVASSAVCESCHLGTYQGSGTTPRVAGQGVDYLRQTMAAFRSGERANNPWMAALLKTYSESDIEALARYLAGL